MDDLSAAPVLETPEELRAFMADLTSQPSVGIYRGLRFETYHFGSPNLLSALALGWFYGIVDRFFETRMGLYIRVFLPQRLDFDLWMESRWQRQEQGDFPDRSFSWSAIDRDRVREVLSGPVQECLREVDQIYRLLVTDEFVRIGPLPPREPIDQMARALDQAVRLAQRISELAPDDESPQEAEPEPLPPAAGPPYKVLVRLTDSMEAEFVQGLLRRHGIPSQVIGTRRSALLGAAPHIFGLKILVAESQHAAANRLLQSISAEEK